MTPQQFIAKMRKQSDKSLRRATLEIGRYNPARGGGWFAKARTTEGDYDCLGYGDTLATAITALTAQDTLGVHEVLPVPAAFIARQINLVLDDIGADAIKTGMLGEAAAIEAIARALGDHPALPLVLDPVMLAKGGATLAGTAAVAAMKRSLIPMAALITPNVPEAEVLAVANLSSRVPLRPSRPLRCPWRPPRPSHPRQRWPPKRPRSCAARTTLRRLARCRTRCPFCR